jgi:transposase
MRLQRDHAVMEKRRLKAAKLFGDGLGPSEVARRLGVRRQSAHAWQKRWRTGGAEALHSAGAAGPKRKLSEEQQRELAAAIVEGPVAHGYTTAVWTLPRIAKLIRQRTGQHYHPAHVSKVLRLLGFSCQRPSRRAIERNEEQIAHWKRVAWPRIKKKPGGKVGPSSSSTKAG